MIKTVLGCDTVACGVSFCSEWEETLQSPPVVVLMSAIWRFLSKNIHFYWHILLPYLLRLNSLFLIFSRIWFPATPGLSSSRRQCRFLSCVVTASNLFKQLCCGTLGLKPPSYIQYVIGYQKSCMLIWHSIFCYL